MGDRITCGRIAVAESRISIVVPFAGDAAAGRVLFERLRAIALRPGDEILVVDNSPEPVLAPADGIAVARADAEASSYYARNVGIEHTSGDWLLFVDADTEPAPDIVARHAERAHDARDGAVAGAIRDPDGEANAIARYIAVRGWFDQAHAADQGRWSFGRTANLLVRRAALEDVGGFCEGIRSTGDTELCWRLARRDWAIAYNDAAAVVHHHRETLAGLVRLSARYAAGAAWVRRRHGEPGYVKEADGAMMAKGLRNAVRALARLDADGLRFRALDALLVLVRRGALQLPNAAAAPPVAPARRVLCAERLGEDERALTAVARPGTRVEALGRPLDRLQPDATRGQAIAYREDDAPLDAWRALAKLARRRPLAVARSLRRDGLAPLKAVAPAAARTLASGAQEIAPLDAPGAALAADLTALTGVRPVPAPGWRPDADRLHSLPLGR